MDLGKKSKEELLDIAKDKGLKFENVTPTKSVLIKAILGVDGDDGEKDPADEEPKKTEVKGKVAIKSIHKGVEIATKYGPVVFDSDGCSEVSSECAEYLTSIEGYENC